MSNALAYSLTKKCGMQWTLTRFARKARELKIERIGLGGRKIMLAFLNYREILSRMFMKSKMPIEFDFLKSSNV